MKERLFMHKRLEVKQYLVKTKSARVENLLIPQTQSPLFLHSNHAHVDGHDEHDDDEDPFADSDDESVTDTEEHSGGIDDYASLPSTRR